MPESQPLKGKVAVISGGSRGIGLSLAQVFARAGCKVVITGRNQRSLKTALQGIKADEAEVTALRCDIGDATAVQKLFVDIRKRYGRIDVLVNNAGMAHPLAAIEKLSPKVWQQVIAINLTGMFLCTRAALPLMKAGATIVNNLSVAAVQPFAGMAAYNASKAGALGFTNVLREELRRKGIRVLALLPGATDTAIWEQFWPDAPREKMVAPATVAEAVLHVVTLPENTTIEEIRLGPTAGVL